MTLFSDFPRPPETASVHALSSFEHHVVIELGRTNISVGSFIDKIVVYRGTFNRFELDIPRNANIMGARFYTRAWQEYTEVPDLRTWEMGLSPIDLWVTDGWTSPQYVNTADMPHPEADDGTDYRAINYFKSEFAFQVATDVIPPAGAPGAEWSFGENMAASVPVTGLIQKLTEWIQDPTVDQLRGVNTVSPTAVPIALVFFRVFDGLDRYENTYYTAAGASAVPQRFPLLEVEWESGDLPFPWLRTNLAPRVTNEVVGSATVSLRTDIQVKTQLRTGVGASVEFRTNVSPSVTDRVTTDPAVTLQKRSS